MMRLVIQQSSLKHSLLIQYGEPAERPLEIFKLDSGKNRILPEEIPEKLLHIKIETIETIKNLY